MRLQKREYQELYVMTVQEIADELGMTHRQVRTTLVRAMFKLQRHIAARKLKHQDYLDDYYEKDITAYDTTTLNRLPEPPAMGRGVLG